MPTLNRLDRIISRDLSVVVSTGEDITSVTAKYLVQDFTVALQRESEHIKGLIMQTVSDASNPNELRRYVRRCQYRLVTLDARLLRYTDADRLVKPLSNEAFNPADVLCNQIHSCLTELLEFIEHHFGRYMYWNAWVHRNYVLISQREVAVLLEQTSEILSDHVSCPQLRQIIQRKFQRFLEIKPGELITYARVRYMKDMLYRLKAGRNNQDGMNSVNDMLLDMNFNSRNYFHYWGSDLIKIVAQKPTTVEKLTLLMNEAARIRQHTFVRKAAYNPHALSLPEMMNRWISEETTRIERLYNIRVLHGGPPESGPQGENDTKTELGISVAVLAAAIKSLIKSNTIPDENLTGLARMLVKCFTTIRSGGSFSVGTFRQSYYEISDSTRLTVIDIFQRAIAWLKKN